MRFGDGKCIFLTCPRSSSRRDGFLGAPAYDIFHCQDRSDKMFRESTMTTSKFREEIPRQARNDRFDSFAKKWKFAKSSGLLLCARNDAAVFVKTFREKFYWMVFWKLEIREFNPVRKPVSQPSSFCNRLLMSPLTASKVVLFAISLDRFFSVAMRAVSCG